MKLALVSPMKSVKLEASRRDVFSIPRGSDHPDERASSMATDQGNTPAPASPKRCSICEDMKPREAFGPDKRTKSGLTSECRACKNVRSKSYRLADPDFNKKQAARWANDPAYRDRMRAYHARYRRRPEVKKREREISKRWTKANPERRRAMRKRHGRAAHLKHAYGLSVQQFDAMRAEQNNACALCSQPFTKTPHVDHDHATDLVRGLLCPGCNLGLGFYEQPGFANACVEYLVRHEQSKRQVG